MSLWRFTRDELAGAWRSLRYDLGYQPGRGRRSGTAETGPAGPEVSGYRGAHASHGHASHDGPGHGRDHGGYDDYAGPRTDGYRFDGPEHDGYGYDGHGYDVTSTGLSTFSGPVLDDLRPGYDEFDRPPRRMVAVAAFGVLALIGAAGSYFAVVNGLGTLLAEKPARPQPFPLVAEAGPQLPEADRPSPTARLGHSAWYAPTSPRQATPQAVATPQTQRQPQRQPAAPALAGRPAGPDPTCECPGPPAPTPTSFPTHRPRPTKHPTPTPTATSPSATPSESPFEPDTSDEPSDDPTTKAQAQAQGEAQARDRGGY